MPVVTTHEPGMLSWADLATTDVAAARRFYTELFGWKTEDRPIPDGGVYVIARIDGDDVAAMSGLDAELRQQGVPPHWNSYFTVRSVDESAAKVVPAGGKLLAPPFDVMDAGRMCVVRDPSGAVFSMWQGKRHRGARRMGEHGALIWTELQTTDVAACREFYRTVFGYNVQTMKMPDGGEYTVFAVGEKGSGGMMAMPPQTPPGTPSHWMVYFGVDDCDAVVEKAKRLGARMCVPPMDIEDVGRMSVLSDPQGATFAILKPVPM